VLAGFGVVPAGGVVAAGLGVFWAGLNPPPAPANGDPGKNLAFSRYLMNMSSVRLSI